jgi:toxin ParE1/3/4
VKRRIIRHDEAISDLVKVALYIAADNHEAAERFVDDAEVAIHRLAEMPGIGILKDLGDRRFHGLHSWPIPTFPNYLIFYRYSDEVLEIVRVLHGARDLPSIFDT